MAQYSKDIRDKFQVKFLHDTCKFSIPLVAAMQGVSRATAHYRYNSITNEIGRYDDTRQQYEEYINAISRCKMPSRVEKYLSNI